MSKREKSDDFVGLGVQGIETSGIESSGSGWGGVGGKPTLSPSLDLQFATDKSITAKKGPTPVFTRGSKATYFGLGVYVGGELLIPIGTSNGRNSWAIADASVNHTLSYDGTRWVARIDPGDFSQDTYYAANGSEWRPDKANWSASGIPSEFIPVEAVGDPVLLITAETNEPRFDHNPVTGACKGLLIEESRTNLLVPSSDFNDATAWSAVRSAMPTANTHISPSGSQDAEKVTPDTTPANNHRIDKTSTSLALNTLHTFSVYAKADGYTGLAVGVSNLGSPLIGVQFELTGSGSVTVQNAGYTGTIQQLSNGWYRCSATFTSGLVTASHRSYLYIGSNGSTFTYAGDNASGVLLWGAQLEAGSFATSYIPTTTIAAARSVDVCSISGPAFIGVYNPPEGTLFIASERISTGVSYGHIFRSSDGTANNRISLGNAGTTHNVEFFIAASGTGSVNQSTNTTAFKKMAGAYKSNDANYSVNGSIGTPDNSVTIPIVDRFEFGSGIIIQSARYYKKRLSNAKLQTITV